MNQTISTSDTRQQASDLFDAGEFEQAYSLYQEASQLEPGDAESWYMLGLTAGILGHSDDAIQHLKRAAEIRPGHAKTHFNLGVAYEGSRELALALEHYHRALELDGQLAAAHANLGAIHLAHEDFHVAVEHFEQCLASEPDDINTQVNLADALLGIPDLKRSQEILSSLRKTAPDNNNALALYCTLLERQRRYDEAYALIEPRKELLGTDYKLTMSFGNLARPLKKRPEAISLLKRLADTQKLNAAQRIGLMFLLGKLCDSEKQFDDAFHYYAEGNRLKRTLNRRIVHSRDVFASQTGRIAKEFTKQRFTGMPSSENESELPVFIVGMPRSGTTLTESILGSHPMVFAAGELGLIADLVGQLDYQHGDGTFILSCLDNLKADVMAKASRYHLEKLEQLASPGVSRVVDKMPHNFRYLGFIARLFPKSRIIHCRRNPIDNCLSLFFQNFQGPHGYAYQLDEIGDHYRQYHELMRHWTDELGISLMTVQYEELVGAPEAISRAMLEHCGLEWDDNCLQFFKNDRFARTASYDQVRQPVYTRSSGRWRNYEKHLDPLIEALGDVLTPEDLA